MHGGEPVTVVLKYTVYEGQVFQRLGWGDPQKDDYYDAHAERREEFAEECREIVREGQASAPDFELWVDGVLAFTDV